MKQYDNRIHCLDCIYFAERPDAEQHNYEGICNKLGVNFQTIKKCPEDSFDHDNDKKFIVPVVYESCGFIKVTASSALEACQLVAEYPDDYPLPYQAEYIDGSFGLSGGIEENAELSEMYTAEYESGKWGSRMIFNERGE